MLLTFSEVLYHMNSRLLIAVLGCAALAFPALAQKRAVQNCQSAAIHQMRKDGYGHVRFKSTNVIGQSYGNRWGSQVWGQARASGWYMGKTFSYSCSMDSNGYVRSASVAMH